jgi:SAM-dependent methyltransferase
LTKRVKDVARRIPPLFWLAGWYRRQQFKRRLAAANLEYQQHGATSIPPPMLRFRVHGALSESGYLERGRVNAAGYADIISRYAPTKSGLSILDFGCGPGRVTTGLKELLPDAKIFGSDIDPEAIGWARAHLASTATFSTNDPDPPLGYQTASFDVVYCNSLFTHLNEQMQFAWLDELARILLPGGLLLATYHGDVTRNSCTPKELAELDRNGILFKVGHTGHLKLDGLPDFYQTTYHTLSYVRSNWTKHFELVQQIPAWLTHQDLAVLRRKA